MSDKKKYNSNKQKLIDIFKKRFQIKENFWTKEMLNEKFLGYKINLMPSDLLYLFYDIEKEFNITIPEEEIVNGNFDCFNNLIKIIEKSIKVESVC